MVIVGVIIQEEHALSKSPTERGIIMSDKVLIGNAVCDENGTVGNANSKPGDQTTKEVRIQDWYSTSWRYVFRADSEEVAENLAKQMEDACNNEAIGYNQTRRTTLYDCAKDKKWKLAKVTTKCECDCSSLVAVCINACGIKISKDMYTGNEKSLIEQTGQFVTLSAEKYLTKDDYLKRGDILLKDGHTAIVLTDGCETLALMRFPAYLGNSVSIVDALNSLGCKSSFSYRKKIAKANGIKAYIGTAKQNTKMLKLLKNGELVKPEKEVRYILNT